MKTSHLLSAATLLLLQNIVSALPSHPAADVEAIIYEVIKRSTPANQPYGYTPQKVTCPSTPPTVRAATGLSTDESTWLQSRRPVAVSATETLLTRLNITGFDASTYFTKHAGNYTALPNIAIAASGGGYRALMNGAGGLAAFDTRTTSSTASGHLGGLLQSATYLAGLSGGSWLIGSLYGNNYTSVQDVIDTQEELWDFTNSILEGPVSSGILSDIITPVKYYDALYDEVKGKEDAGFNVSLTDYWGRALSFQLINATDGGPAYTFSSIADQTFFTDGSVPMPIFISDSRAPGQVLIPSNTTIFEFNPFEFGSWDPDLYGFVDMKYVGTNMSDGAVASGEKCVTGYDNIGFVYGTSSTLFNEIVLDFNSTVTDLPDFLIDAIQDLLDDFGESDNDIAQWVNPFYNYDAAENPVFSVSDQLTLVDGGEDNENIPFHPLIQPVRAVDVIFAIDSSADTTYNWPNGSSLVATYERTLNTSLQNGTAFPYIPDTNTFINLGLNIRPTFFGCNASNYTTNNPNTTHPLIVYLPNAPYTAYSNVSTYDLSYTDTQRNEIITNGLNVASRGNGTLDAEWPVCVGCAILARSLERTGTAFPAVCSTCFTDYCWNGTINSTTPAAYLPTLLLSNTTSTAAAASATSSSAAVGAMAAHGLVAAIVAGLATVLV